VTRTVDYTALTAPVTKQEVKAFKAEMRASGVSWGSGAVIKGLAVGCAFIVLAAIAVTTLTSFVSMSSRAMADGGSPATLLSIVVPLAFIVGLVAVASVGLRSALGMRSWEKWMRLSRFAAANGLVFSASSPDPQYPGAIFGQGHSRKALDHLRSTGDRFLDMGNYRYTTGSGKNSTTHNWGFMALHLDRRLPHMVLDSKANNSWFGTNLPSTFKKEQALALEGDFNEYFTLYCPREYERDALYVFTPDLMALLIDEAAPFDVEIVDDWMFVYSSTVFNTASPAVYQRLFRIVDTVGAKTLSQTDRYVDERIGTFAANIVAPQGQRLKRGVPVAAIIITAVFGAIWILPRIIDIFN